MSQDQHGYQPNYDFGRGRSSRQAPADQTRREDQQVTGPDGYRLGTHPQAYRDQMIPPPPNGHRGMFVLALLYAAGLFMLIWTGASVGVTLDHLGGPESDQVVIGMVMAAGSLLITAGLGAWIIRIHRRRAAYRRILDQHYAWQFGHHPGKV